MVDNTSKLGSKIGPRIANLVSDAYVSSRQKLLDTDHRLQVNATQSVINAAGLEVGNFSQLLLAPILNSDAIPSEYQAVFTRAASGQHQWEAMILGGAASVAMGGGLGALFSNILAGAIRGYNSIHPSLQPDVGTVAQLTARGFIQGENPEFVAAGEGFNATWFNRLVAMAEQYPSPDTVVEMLRRGFIDAATAENYLHANGIQPGVSAHFLRLVKTFLSPADAALAVLRGNMSHGDGVAIAKEAGLSSGDFNTLVDNTGEPPSLTEMLSLWRRGKASTGDLERAVRESHIRDDWFPLVKQMGVIPPTPVDMLNAYLEGQLSEGEAKSKYEQLGGDPEYFDILFNTQGQAPTPVEALTLANRGIIPWKGTGPNATSFEQAFLEGPWRNKWLKPFIALGEYLPPPRTVTAMYNEGALSRNQAIDLLMKQGLTKELATAYTVSGSNQKTADTRNLAVSTITTLYKDQAISRDDANGMLTDLGYDKDEADFILLVSDLQRVQRFTETAISTVHTQYINHKIDVTTAANQLDGIGVPAGQRDELLTLWDLERATKVVTLTASQIRSAVGKNLLSQDEALTRLTQLGYSQQDAGIYLQL